MTTSTANVAGGSESAGGLSLRLLKSVNMSTLSQSELCAISSLGNDHSPSLTPTIVASSAIDRSSFNESYGSRRQIYSRLSSLSHHHHRHHRLTAPLPKSHSEDPASQNPNPDLPNCNPEVDQDRIVCRSILDTLRQLISSSPDFQLPDPIDVNCFNNFYPLDSYAEFDKVNEEEERKMKKRGRKPKSLGGDSVVLLNKNREMVNIVALESMNDPYGEELARRTSGLNMEDDLLHFIACLRGEWCSSRKRRKVVEADEFGDALPLGWKLLLALRRKEGFAWVYCRRYVSPDGQHFVSCKDVATYLRSYMRYHETRMGNDFPEENLPDVTLPSFADELHENDISMLELDNLVDVEVREIYSCYKCNIPFSEKESYFKHLFSVHRSKKQRGVSVAEGVILRDGKFECQFCHKVFDEKRRYNSHVGIHVRNYVRGVEDAPGVRLALESRSYSPMAVDLPSRSLKTDVFVDHTPMENACKLEEFPANSEPDRNAKSELGIIESDSSTDGEDGERNHQPIGMHGSVADMDDASNIIDITIQDHSFGVNSNTQVVDAKVLEPQETIFTLPMMENHEETCHKNMMTKGGNQLENDDDQLLNTREIQESGGNCLNAASVSFAAPNNKLLSSDIMDIDGILDDLTTLCVWCGVEFVHDTPDTGFQSESADLMCLTCKAKISGAMCDGSS